MTTSYAGADGELFSGILFASFEPPEYLCWKKDYFNETVKQLIVKFLH